MGQNYGTNSWLDVGGATSGMNNSMAGIALAQRQAQYRMQQFAAQQALEQQKIDIERQAETRLGRGTDSTIAYQGAEQKRAEAQAMGYGLENDLARSTMATQGRLGRLQGYESSPDVMSMVQDPFSGPQMMGDLRDANVVPHGQFQLTREQLMQAIQGALRGQMTQQAAGTPASAARMTEQIPVSAGGSLVDPFSHERTYQGIQPRNEYDQARNAEQARHNQQMEEQARLRELAVIAGNALMPSQLKDAARQQVGGKLGVNYTPTPPENTTPDNSGLWDRIKNVFSPTGQQQAAPVAPPHLRQKGDHVTTAKGTFVWDGASWQPVKQ